MAGISEIEDTVKAAMDIVKAATTVGKDGWQITDAGLLINNDQLRAAITRALEGADRIPGELRDLDFMETMQLAQTSLNAIKSLNPLRK